MTQQLDTLLVTGSTLHDYEKKTGAVNIPIYASSTFDQSSFDSFGPFDYSRSGNPTRDALEKTIARLENGHRGFAFSSGIAAITATLLTLNAGDHLVITNEVYGGTYRFVTTLLPKYGISHSFADFTDLAAVEAAIQPNTVVLYAETPANPLLGITDIRGVVALAQKYHLKTFVDNTFMTPLYQQPLALGVDVVLHSATKFLGGHSEVIAGLAITKDEEMSKAIYAIQNGMGAILSPHDSFSVIQGIKTLRARLDFSSRNAQKIAEFLHAHEDVVDVYYPGLPCHIGYAIHQSQSTSAGAVLSFTLPTKQFTQLVVEHMTIPIFAVSLGGVESILSYPPTMSHAAIPLAERQARGITDGLLRLSVGLENVDDLIADLSQALAIAATTTANMNTTAQ
ncbi:methionine biosynthesis PLP-dependent protein [Kurthia sibirica]|uniref:cysteine-S-conjugate beta-lyase n=1 Tax=Kurthia sibirica TaxID=202750 RepID=A0A2U3APN8_9BACL|nr:methionine biosynthesis PLP-dependent protein [Kurthia sibirica]